MITIWLVGQWGINKATDNQHLCRKSVGFIRFVVYLDKMKYSISPSIIGTVIGSILFLLTQ